MSKKRLTKNLAENKDASGETSGAIDVKLHNNADPTSASLVVIGERKITVHVGTFVTALRREVIRREIEKRPSESIEEQVARYNFYAPMAACSTGDVPTETEFLNMSEQDVDVWYQQVLKKNPLWFESQESEEKKSS
jgi:hypothetical protein